MTTRTRTPLIPESDHIANMFENIRPEDFFRETSAVKTETIQAVSRNLGLHASELGFELFVRAQLDRCREEASTGEFIPQAVLANSDEYRFFHGEDDEVPADFARRLQREAKTMNAYRMFVAIVSPARAILPGQTPPPLIDPDDMDAVREALVSGELRFGVCWTAANGHGADIDYRGGIVYLDDDGNPTDEVQGDMDPDVEDPFTEVLAWH